jgi:hypothetical protein
VQWCVSFNIYQVKNKNYPKKYWKQQLILSLQARNKFAVDILKMNRSDFEKKIVPIFIKYAEKYNSSDEKTQNKFRKIQNAVLLAYIKNPKVDLNSIAMNADLQGSLESRKN